MFASNVQPRRRVKAIPKAPWKCDCGAENKYFWNPCPSCGKDRPK